MLKENCCIPSHKFLKLDLATQISSFTSAAIIFIILRRIKQTGVLNRYSYTNRDNKTKVQEKRMM